MKATCFEDIMLDRPDTFLEDLTDLRNNGASSDSINEFVKANMDAYLADDIVSKKPNDWAAIGVDPKDYIETWLNYYGESYFSEFPLKDLPEAVSIVDFTNHFSAHDLITLPNVISYEYFIEEYVGAGGKVDDLASKIIDEYGYKYPICFAEVLLELVLANSTVVDVDRLMRGLNPNSLEPEARDFYYEELLNLGYRPERINKLHI